MDGVAVGFVKYIKKNTVGIIFWVSVDPRRVDEHHAALLHLDAGPGQGVTVYSGLVTHLWRTITEWSLSDSWINWSRKVNPWMSL